MDQGSPWIAAVVIIILVAINGILASAEIALVGLNETRLREKAADGDKKSILLLKMKQNPSDFLSAVQVGITLAGLLSGAFAADTLAQPIISWLERIGVEGGALSVLRVVSSYSLRFY
jgi:putative hemolysin